MYSSAVEREQDDSTIFRLSDSTAESECFATLMQAYFFMNKNKTDQICSTDGDCKGSLFKHYMIYCIYCLLHIVGIRQIQMNINQIIYKKTK